MSRVKAMAGINADGIEKMSGQERTPAEKEEVRVFIFDPCQIFGYRLMPPWRLRGANSWKISGIWESFSLQSVCRSSSGAG